MTFDVEQIELPDLVMIPLAVTDFYLINIFFKKIIVIIKTNHTISKT